MTERGRMEWQRLTGYGRRALAKTAMSRWKHLIGPKLRARTISGQQGEAALAVAVLNRMTQTAKLRIPTKSAGDSDPNQPPVPSEASRAFR